jgi:ABC-2 type transport system permease protein
MLMGIGMLAGTAREEEDKTIYRIIGKRRSLGVMRLVSGRALAYFVVYYALAAILLGFMPRLLGIPHIGDIGDILRFNVPYILACVFFAMTISIFVHERESGLVLLISTSLVFFFLAGVSWPKEMMPDIWKSLAYLLPYTFGAHGFIHMNSMGATLEQVEWEYVALWQQALWYFIVYSIFTYVASKWSEKKLNPFS